VFVMSSYHFHAEIPLQMCKNCLRNNGRYLNLEKYSNNLTGSMHNTILSDTNEDIYFLITLFINIYTTHKTVVNFFEIINHDQVIM